MPTSVAARSTPLYDGGRGCLTSTVAIVSRDGDAVPVIRVGSRDVVAALQSPSSRDHREAPSRLRSWLRRAHLNGAADSLLVLRSPSITLLVTGANGEPAPDAALVAWGHPFQGTSPVSDDELRQAAAPGGAALDGVYALFHLTPSGLRVVTSRWPVAVVRESRAGEATAWASRAGAARALLGLATAISTERVPERIAFELAIGDDELTDGVTVLREGTTVSAAEGQPVTRSTPADAAGPPPHAGADADALRIAVGDVAARALSAPNAFLGLTAGRDSTLVASCLADRGAVPRTFTLGHRQLPDLHGARAVAQALDWSHQQLVPHAYDGTPWDSTESCESWIASATRGPAAGAALFAVLVAAAEWTEGAGHCRDALAGRIRWPDPRTVWVSGSGGEIGRAFYWHGQSPSADPVATLTRDWGSILSADALDILRQRVATECAAYGVDEPATTLDLFYVRNRMRKWLGQGLPDAGLHGIVPIYLHPTIVSLLLGLAVEDRAAGTTFDRALRLGAGDLYGVAQRAAVGDARPVRPQGRVRLPGRVQRRLSRPTPGPYPNDWPLLAALLDHLDRHGYRFRDSFDPAWFAMARRSGAAQPWVRPPLWALVAAEAASHTG